MALLSSKNMKKAKALLDKNKDKVSDAVEKGAATLDKATKGKTAAVSAKATAAAKKYAGEATPTASAPTTTTTPRHRRRPSRQPPDALRRVLGRISPRIATRAAGSTDFRLRRPTWSRQHHTNE